MERAARVEKAFTDKWAFLVGVSEYRRVRSLGYAARDAADLKTALVEHLDFPPEHTFLIADESDFEPTRDEILHQLAGLPELGIARDDLLVFHFSGHGVRDHASHHDYVLPKGASTREIEDTGIPVERIVGRLHETGCENIVLLLDMCREDSAKGLMSSVGDASKSVVDRPGIATFFSCDPRELSYEIEDLKHGAFTHCVLQAIKDDSVGTIGELDSYLRREVPRLNEYYGKQTQRPFLVSNPHEIANLLIFPLCLRGVEAGEVSFEDLTKVYEAGRIPGEIYVEAVKYIKQGPSLSEARCRMLRELCEQTVDDDAFVLWWREFAKRSRGPAPKVRGRTRFGAERTKEDPDAE